MNRVTDPNLLAQLNGKVTDPAILAQLNGEQHGFWPGLSDDGQGIRFDPARLKSLGNGLTRETGVQARAMGPTLAGAGTGAAIGSSAGPLGTAGGAIVGGIVGSMRGGVMDRVVNYLADKAGAVKYEDQTNTEKTMGAIGQGIAATGAGLGAGGAINDALLVGKNLPKIAPYVAKLLTDNPIRQAAGAAGAGAMGSMAAQDGKGPGGQIWASLLGGLAGHNLAGLPYETYGAVKSLANPSIRAGQAVGDLLLDHAVDPYTAMKQAKNPAQFVPGSDPTTAQATLDPGLIGIDNGVRQFPLQDPVFTQIMNRQNSARQGLFTSTAGTPESLQGLIDEREAVTGPMRNKAFDAFDNDPRRLVTERGDFKQDVRNNLLPFGDTNWSNKNTQQKLASILQGYGFDVGSKPSTSGKGTMFIAEKLHPITGQPITINYRAGANPANMAGIFIDLAHPQQGPAALADAIVKSEPFRPVVNDKYPLGVIDRTLQSPEGNNAQVREAMQAASEEIGKANNIQDPRFAYPVKKSIQTVAQASLDKNGPRAGSARLAAGMMGPVMDSLDSQINKATGGLYQPYLDQYSAMSKPINQSELLQELQHGSALQTPDIYGNRQLSAPSMGRQLTSNSADIAKTLTPEQQLNLKNIKSDLDRAHVAANTPGRATNSATIRNYLMAQMLGKLSIAADNPILGKTPVVGQALGLTQKGAEAIYTKPTINRLSEAMQMPHDAAELMTEAAKRRREIDNLMRTKLLYGQVAQPLLTTMGSRQ